RAAVYTATACLTLPVGGPEPICNETIITATDGNAERHSPQLAASAAPLATGLAAAYSGRSPTIDGELSADEWSDARVYRMDALDTAAPGVVVEGNPTSAADSSAAIYLKHDTNYLYVAVAVADDHVVGSASNGKSWHADAVELYLDSNNSDSKLKYPGDANGFHMSTSADGTQTAGSLKGTGVWDSAGRVGGSGYVVEYRISKPATNMTTGGTYGFDVAVIDNDSRPEELVYFYTATTRATYDEAQWGSLTLEKVPPPMLAVSPAAGLTASGVQGG